MSDLHVTYIKDFFSKIKNKISDYYLLLGIVIYVIYGMILKLKSGIIKDLVFVSKLFLVSSTEVLLNIGYTQNLYKNEIYFDICNDGIFINFCKNDVVHNFNINTTEELFNFYKIVYQFFA